MKIRYIFVLALVLFSFIPKVMAQAELPDEISEEDKAKFDSILEPVLKIYNFIKYIASVVAGIFLLYAGITYMSSGTDQRNVTRQKALRHMSSLD